MKHNYSLPLIVGLFLALIIGDIFTTQAQVPSFVRADGLHAWYPFSGNTNDATATGADLTNLGAGLTTDKNGNADAAYEFDGANFYMKADDFGAGLANNLTEIVFSCWFQMAPGETSGGLVTYGEIPNRTVHLYKAVTPGRVSSIMYNSINEVNQVELDFGNANDTAWHHAVFVHDEVGLNVFVDGVLGNAIGVQSTMLKGETLRIGVWNDLTSYFAGKLDDIGVWLNYGSNHFTWCDVMKLYTEFHAWTIADTNVEEGGNAIFVVAIEGIDHVHPEIGFQWEVHTGIGDWQPLSNAGQYSGVNSGMLQVSNVTTSNNNYQYRCMISYGAACEEPSEEVTLTVSPSSIWDAGNTIPANIYPNPGNGQVTIEATLNDAGYVQTTVVDITGKTVYTENAKCSPGAYRNTIELDLPSGMYHLTLQTENGRATKKIQVVNK